MKIKIRPVISTLIPSNKIQAPEDSYLATNFSGVNWNDIK